MDEIPKDFLGSVSQTKSNVALVAVIYATLLGILILVFHYLTGTERMILICVLIIAFFVLVIFTPKLLSKMPVSEKTQIAAINMGYYIEIDKKIRRLPKQSQVTSPSGEHRIVLPPEEPKQQIEGPHK